MRAVLVTRVLLALGLLAGSVLATNVFAAPRVYVLPEETAEFAAGPHLDTVQGNCAACHSAEYVATQPRTFADPRAFWTAEVVKMQKAYGAPVDNADVLAIVDYLVQTYGR